SARRTDQRFMSAHRNELRKPSQGTGGRGRVGSVLRAHLATTTVVDSLSPQRSAGRGLGRGVFDLCLPMVPAELLLSRTLSSTPRRRGGLVVMSRRARVKRCCAPNIDRKGRLAHLARLRNDRRLLAAESREPS